jgi:hypothetical protein
MERFPFSFALSLVLSIPLALAGCGGNVVTQPTGGPDTGGSGQGGQPMGGTTGEGGATTSSVSTSSVSTGGSGGASDCAGLGEIACLGAHPTCVPVYDDQCCPMCDPTGGCADCVNWGFHHCATLENGCLPEMPIECGVVPGWACSGGSAACEPASPLTKTPCATVPGCVASYCPVDVECETDPVCVPVDKDMCSEALCDAVPPNCAPGTIPAVEAGCYTGGCILAGVCSP